MAYGNSTQPGTKHRTDQVKLLSERKLRTLWMTYPMIKSAWKKRQPSEVGFNKKWQ